jgi:hypothetical protein
MTKGIFHHDRFLVTEVGIRYGIEKCDCPLLCVVPLADGNTFDFDTKCHQLSGHHKSVNVHPTECCQDVDENFQYIAKGIPAAIDVAKWRRRDGELFTEYTQQYVTGIVQRYLVRESSLKKLKREINLQRSLQICQSRDENVEEKDENVEEELDQKDQKEHKDQEREKDENVYDGNDGNDVEIEGDDIVEWKL